MIKKTFELNKKIIEESKIFLFYGVNQGAKKELINNIINNLDNKNIEKLDQKEVLENQNNFFENILTKSLFENNKIIIINDASDKILKLIQEISEINDDQTKIILNSGLLEKKSKLRNFCEKDKKSICVALYRDEKKPYYRLQKNTLENKIIISRMNLNLIINKCNGDRGILNNELEKIKFYSSKNKKVETKDLIKLINLIENHNVDELTNNFLAKNKKRVIYILNENNYTRDDCIPLLKNLLFKTKKLSLLIQSFSATKNLSLTINNSKPPIFWKDKEIVSKQVLGWSQADVKKLIYLIFNTELEIKKNYENSINIMRDFLMKSFSETNNDF